MQRIVVLASGSGSNLQAILDQLHGRYGIEVVAVASDKPSAEALELVCHWAFRRRGVAVARKARAMLDPGAESPGESRARVVLLVGRVPAPECNADVIHLGEWLARADMLWRRQRVIVEYDGAVHLAEEQRRRDAVRRNLLQSAGWFVIVFTARDLRHPEQMCRLVKDALNRGNSTRS